MSDTHPNAYRQEAEKKRQEAALAADEANRLEDLARQAELELGITEPGQADGDATDSNANDTEDERKHRFSRK